MDQGSARQALPFFMLPTPVPRLLQTQAAEGTGGPARSFRVIAE